jgi:hypothetical protein
MDDKTKGAWLVHHTMKLQKIREPLFENISFAGKCGLLLSQLSSDQQAVLANTKVKALSMAVNIHPKTELPSILKELEDKRLIKQSSQAVECIGLTSSSALLHTAQIYEANEKRPEEDAVLTLAEEASKIPQFESDLIRVISDNFKIPTIETKKLISTASQIEFTDKQEIDGTHSLIFNGNLFRFENPYKVKTVLESLNATDKNNFYEVENLLTSLGCVAKSTVTKILGDRLFRKLHSIGVFDVSAVSNDMEEIEYVTRPGAFRKYSNFTGDAFDLVKAFVSSLTYGMTRSYYSRGRIGNLDALLQALIDGRELKPTTAAGQDYKILETRNVIALSDAGRGMFRMRLLKKEVGEMALSILRQGDISEQSLELPGASIIKYNRPEDTRICIRKSVGVNDKLATDILNNIRMGKFS